jgi:hypothetical protein
MASLVVALVTITFAFGSMNVQPLSPGQSSVPSSHAEALGAKTASLFFFALLTASPNFGDITLGQTVTLNATAYGGNPPLNYAYTNLPTGCTSVNTSNLNCTPTATGTWTVEVTLTDTSQAQTTANATVIVTAATSTHVPTSPTTPTTSSSATPSLGVYGLIIVLFVVLLAGAAWQAFGSSPESPPETPRAPPST